MLFSLQNRVRELASGYQTETLHAELGFMRVVLLWGHMVLNTNHGPTFFFTIATTEGAVVWKIERPLGYDIIIFYGKSSNVNYLSEWISKNDWLKNWAHNKVVF